MQNPIILFIIFLLISASSCRTKKLDLRNEYTILSISEVKEGSHSVFSGYVFNREDNSVVGNARINLIRPPLEKLFSTPIKENGYFEIELSKGKYNFQVVRGADILLNQDGLKIPQNQKVEVLIYLKKEE